MGKNLPFMFYIFIVENLKNGVKNEVVFQVSLDAFSIG